MKTGSPQARNVNVIRAGAADCDWGVGVETCEPVSFRAKRSLSELSVSPQMKNCFAVLKILYASQIGPPRNRRVPPLSGLAAYAVIHIVIVLALVDSDPERSPAHLTSD